KMKNMKHVFAEIDGGKSKEEINRFRKTVSIQGRLRAWFKRGDPTNEGKGKAITINNLDVGCESKRYNAKYYKIGMMAAKRAKELYMKSQHGQGKDSYYLTCTNDRMFIVNVGMKWY